MAYLCISFLIAFLLLIELFLTKQENKKLTKHKQTFIMAMTDFQTQIDSLNTSFAQLQGMIGTLNSTVADLTTKLGATLSPDEAATLLTDLTNAANEFKGLVPPTE